MVDFIVDHREHKSILRVLAKEGIDYKKEQLGIADFLIKSKANGEETTVAIERKTLEDFLNSIIDKRLLIQLAEMRERYKVAVLIIEGNENIYQMRNMHPNAIRGMMVTIAIDFQVPIIRTLNPRDTVMVMKNMAERLTRSRKPISMYSRRTPLSLEDQKLYLLESLPGVGATLAKSLLREFGSVEKVMNASLKDLQKVDKLGPKKAEKIKEVLD